jgi:serine protease Do
MNARSYRWGAALCVATLAVGGLLWHQSHSAAQQPLPVKSSVPPPSVAAPEAIHHANSLSHAFRAASNVILPSVVTIETSSKPKMVRGGGNRMQNGENPFKGTPFENFFNDEQLKQFGEHQERRQPRSQGAGSGVIIDKAGIILTNNHVVAGADDITVRLADGREFKAVDVKTDPQTDLAIVRIEKAGDLTAAKIGNSDEMMIGDWVIAVGNPFGLEQTVSAGIISGKGRQFGSGQRANYLQTDAAINPGNSGGPLVNLDGEVIGINTAIASHGGGNDGIGFAVPSNMVKWVAPQLVAGGQVKRAYLGVGIEQLNNELATRFGVKHGEGVLVTEVFPDTPAAAAGLKEGDIILSFDGTAVHSPRELQEVVERSTMDAKHPAQVLRDGKQVTIDVVAKSLPSTFGRTAAKPGNAEDAPAKADSVEQKELGLEASDLSAAQAKQLGFDGFTGVLITQVDPDGPAYEAGLREGMLIRKVGREDVTSIADFRRLVGEQSLKDGVLLLVRTPAGNRYVVLQPK